MRLRTEKGIILLDDDDYRSISNKIFIDGYGYACIGRWDRQLKKSTPLRLHRVIMDAQKGEYVDHINGNKLDNRKQNLRICTNQLNGMNRVALNKNNKSGYRGVYWDRTNKKWSAQIKVNYKNKRLGRFDTVEQAVEAQAAALNEATENILRFNSTISIRE